MERSHMSRQKRLKPPARKMPACAAASESRPSATARLNSAPTDEDVLLWGTILLLVLGTVVRESGGP